MGDDDFQRALACYQNNFEQARSLNTQMSQVPVLAMTLTGGLWFGAGVTENLFSELRFGLLLFAGFCNIALILAALRIRDVFHSYLEKIKEFHPSSFAGGRPSNPKMPKLGDYSMISIYCALMAIGSALSFTGALGFYWPFAVTRWLGAVILIATLAVIYFALFRRSAETSESGAG